MSLHDLLTSLGINPTLAYAGFFGGILRALSRKRFKLREVFASPICGLLAAGYLTEPVIHYLRLVNWPLPPDDGTLVTQHAAGFLIGVMAMWITDIVLDIIVRRFSVPKDDQN